MLLFIERMFAAAPNLYVWYNTFYYFVFVQPSTSSKTVTNNIHTHHTQQTHTNIQWKARENRTNVSFCYWNKCSTLTSWPPAMHTLRKNIHSVNVEWMEFKWIFEIVSTTQLTSNRYKYASVVALYISRIKIKVKLATAKIWPFGCVGGKPFGKLVFRNGWESFVLAQTDIRQYTVCIAVCFYLICSRVPNAHKNCLVIKIIGILFSVSLYSLRWEWERPLIGLKEVPCRFRKTHKHALGRTPLSMMKRADIHFASRQMADHFNRPLSRSINYLARALDFTLIKIDPETLTDKNTSEIIIAIKANNLRTFFIFCLNPPLCYSESFVLDFLPFRFELIF